MYNCLPLLLISASLSEKPAVVCPTKQRQEQQPTKGKIQNCNYIR